MTREPDPRGFDAIVAAWRAEGNVPEWPDDLHLEQARREARTDLRADARPDPEVDDGVDEQAPGHPDPSTPSGPDHPSTDRPPTDVPDAMRSDRGDPGPNTYGPEADHPSTDPDADGPTADGPDVMRSDRFDADHPSTYRSDADHPTAEHRGAARRGADPGVEGAAERRAAEGERGHPARPGAAQPHPDEHFVPPEPPPLPRMGPPILIGLTLIGLGLVLVTLPGWVGVPQVYGLPLGLVAIAAGLGWLVLRLWPDPDDVPPPLYLDDPDDPDGGAVL